MSITDTFIPPYEQIVDLEYYTNLYNKPHTNAEVIQDTQFSKLLIQVIDQINVLCAGRVFREWTELDDAKQADAERKFYLRRAICAYLEYCIDTAHIFVNKQFQSTGTIPFSLNASANDANFENLRFDIIKLLKQGNWYATLYGINPTELATKELGQIDNNAYLTWLVKYLKTIFKTIDNKNQFTNGLVLSNNDITTVKNITAYSNQSEISGFRLHLDNNLITTESLISEAKEINVEANKWTNDSFEIQIADFDPQKDYLLQCDNFNVLDADGNAAMPGFIQNIQRREGYIRIWVYFLPYRTGTYQFKVSGIFNILKR